MDDNKKQSVDRVEIEFYTDPLCCWSWAFEPHWRRLRFEYAGIIAWRYRMGGLVPNWKSYNDPMNSVARPVQMGPVWMEAHHISGMPINNKIWFENPPASSYPSCIAVKCAELQSPDAAEAYLRRTREAVMIEGLDISKQEVLLTIGEDVEKKLPQIFNFGRFSRDLKENAGKDTFREDMQKARYHQISRFPTLTIRQPGEPGIMIVGYRPYHSLLTALKQIAPDIRPTQQAENPDVLRNFWGDILDAEMATILSPEKSH